MGRIESSVKRQLRGLPRHDGETFPWPLVELYVKEGQNPIAQKPNDLPAAQAGYDWYWVDDMAALSGFGGWLEVDLANKKQGRFKFIVFGFRKPHPLVGADE